MQIQSAGHSDVGRVREKNEDSYVIVDELGLFVVADGMGGHVAGHRASQIAVKAVEDAVRENNDDIIKGASADPLESSPVPRILAGAVRFASASIFKTAKEDPSLQGMGTTVTSLLVRNDRAFIAHVGDSRCYLQRNNQVWLLTDDHSLVNEELRAGLITREEARSSQRRNIITRSVGYEKDVVVDTFALAVQAGDKFLLCSDGLSNFVDDTEVGLALASLGIDEVPHRMVDLANERGGDDNITVVCVLATDG